MNVVTTRKVPGNAPALVGAQRELVELHKVERPKAPTPEGEAVQENRQRWERMTRGAVHVSGEAV